jgi:hypothetical protein
MIKPANDRWVAARTPQAHPMPQMADKLSCREKHAGRGGDGG